jgi:hypothetical protein
MIANIAFNDDYSPYRFVTRQFWSLHAINGFGQQCWNRSGRLSMSRVLAMLWSLLFVQAVAAEPINCATPIAKANKEIGKVTGDLQGMEKMMPASEMTELRGLVGQANRLKGEAEQSCVPNASPYQRAEAIAQATSANGYATAADILHFNYMEIPAGRGAASGMGDKGAKGGMSAMHRN